MSARFAVFASGSGTNFQALLDAEKADAPWRVAVLFSDRPCAAEGRARAAGRPVHRIGMDPGAADELLGLLDERRVDGVLLAGFLRLVPAAVCAAYRGRILNVHPSLLPAFGGRGMHGRRIHEAVLASGAAVSGATVHHVNERYDEGGIMAQWPVPVMPDDTPESLAARVLAVEHVLYPEAVAALARSLDRGAPPTFRWPGPDRRETGELRRAVRAAFGGPAGQASA